MVKIPKSIKIISKYYKCPMLRLNQALSVLNKSKIKIKILHLKKKRIKTQPKLKFFLVFLISYQFIKNCDIRVSYVVSRL
jgi:hypothetical protein